MTCCACEQSCSHTGEHQFCQQCAAFRKARVDSTHGYYELEDPRVMVLRRKLRTAKDALEACETAIFHAIELGHLGAGSTLRMCMEAVSKATGALDAIDEK